MLATRTVLVICGLLGASACVRDGHPRERTSVSEVTNKMAAQDPSQEGTRREHYNEVSPNDALGRGNDTNSALASTPATSGSATSGSATSGSSEGLQNIGKCELDVYFETDSTRLGQNSQQRLDDVAECMKRREVDHATIVGQTDPSGTKEHNEKLGLERARVVAEYLKGRGVPEDQIRVRSKGELASAQNPDLWPQQRKSDVQTTR
jgi:outer membrane protein OmpA-like peptidoglycan-associated protein